MVMATLSETEHEFKSLNAERLLTILENHPAKSSALTLGLVLKLAKHYASERNKHVVLIQTADRTGMRT